MRNGVTTIQSFGVLPNSGAGIDSIGQWEKAIALIEQPVTDEEAIVLLSALPRHEDDCYGLAWSLLHACETAPGYSAALVARSRVTGYWRNLLLLRLQNGRSGKG